jgi:hypothetical protein
MIDNYSLENVILTKKGDVGKFDRIALWNEDNKHISNIAFVQNITKINENLIKILSKKKNSVN